MKDIAYSRMPLYSMVRETMDLSYGRNYLFLLFFEGNVEKGFYIDPYEENRLTMFQSCKELEQKIERLIICLQEQDRRGELVKCCNRWIKRGLPENISAALCFSVLPDGTWKGRIYCSSEGEESYFTGRHELRELLKIKFCDHSDVE